MMQLIAGGLMGLTLGAWLHLSRLCIRKSTCRHLLLALGLAVLIIPIMEIVKAIQRAAERKA